MGLGAKSSGFQGLGLGMIEILSITLRTPFFGSYGRLLAMGNAGFISSAVMGGPTII